MLPRERVGGHHARDCAGSWGLPPQRPARTLPHRGPNAPISEEPLGGVGSEVQSEGEVPKAVFAVPSEADGEGKAQRRPSLYGVVPLLLGGLDRESSDPDLVLSAVPGMFGPSWVSSGATEVSSEVLGTVRS